MKDMTNFEVWCCLDYSNRQSRSKRCITSRGNNNTARKRRWYDGKPGCWFLAGKSSFSLFLFLDKYHMECSIISDFTTVIPIFFQPRKWNGGGNNANNHGAWQICINFCAMTNEQATAIRITSHFFYYLAANSTMAVFSNEYIQWMHRF